MLNTAGRQQGQLTRAPVRQRKVSVAHFAFMRALVQGLDARDTWERYLQIDGRASDVRVVRRTVRWLRDEFAAAAKRHHKFGTARLVLIEADRIPEQPTQQLPTLDEFVDARQMWDFSEKEQQEAYAEEYGAAKPREARRARVIRQQLQALSWLEQLVSEAPQALDGVAAWFAPELAARLEDAGLFSLRRLAEHINGIGRHWYRSIPAIGEEKARRIEAWLTVHSESTGLSIGWHAHQARRDVSRAALQTVVPRSGGIVPLEKFLIPSELSGMNGALRLPQHLCLMAARNDYEAICAWIGAKGALSAEKRLALQAKRGVGELATLSIPAPLQYLSHTGRAYIKEAERLLLWSILVRRKPLSSLMLEDCVAYREFLCDPQPAEQWCGPRGRERWSPLWRPFEGPLKANAQRRAISVIKVMVEFFNDQNYMRGNPWRALKTPKKTGPVLEVGRSFTRWQWDYLRACAAMLPPTSAHLRLRTALAIFGGTGIRLAEGVAAQVRHLEWVSYPADATGGEVSGWELVVVGKGDKERRIPVPPPAIEILGDYLASRGFARAIELAPPDTFLFGLALDIGERAPWSAWGKKANAAPLDPCAGITAGTLYEQLKGFFAGCAQALRARDPRAAGRLEQASTHWLRHTYASQAIAAGVGVKSVQQLLGHADISTTTPYTNTEQRFQMIEASKMWAQGAVLSGPTLAAPNRPQLANAAVEGETIAHVQLRLELHSRGSSRGRNKARAEIEGYHLAEYAAQRLASGDYALQVPHSSAQDLVARLTELARWMEMVAIDRDCAITYGFVDQAGQEIAVDSEFCCKS